MPTGCFAESHLLCRTGWALVEPRCPLVATLQPCSLQGVPRLGRLVARVQEEDPATGHGQEGGGLTGCFLLSIPAVNYVTHTNPRGPRKHGGREKEKGSRCGFSGLIFGKFLFAGIPDSRAESEGLGGEQEEPRGESSIPRPGGESWSPWTLVFRRGARPVSPTSWAVWEPC